MGRGIGRGTISNGNKPERITSGSPALAMAAFAGALVLLAVWDYRNVGDQLEGVAQAIGFSALAVHLLAGLTGALLVRAAKFSEDRSGLAARMAIKLRFTEVRHEAFWRHAPDGLFSVEIDEQGGFVFSGINPALERLTGLSDSDIVGKSPERCLRADLADAVAAKYRECVCLGRPLTYEETLLLPAGVRHFCTTLVPVRHPVTRRIVQIFGSARDVTEAREGRDELFRLKECLRSILSSVSDCYCTLDSDYRLTFANAAALRWAGKDAASVLGRSYKLAYKLKTPAGRAIIRAMERREVIHEELPSIMKEGRWLHYDIYPSTDGGLAIFFRDVTKIREAEEALKEVPRQMLASQESERRRIASELHDSTTQHIVAANLNLMRLSPPANQSDADARDDIQRSLDEALQELRVSTYLLHPPALHRDGLVATLRAFLDGFGRRAQLVVSLRASPGLDELPTDLQHAVFRVVQEAASNAHRHARANRVGVQARLIRGTLCVRISDDGRGICAAQSRELGVNDAPVGVGLPGMRARLKQFGGDLRVRSGVNGRSGAVIVASVPLARKMRASGPPPKGRPGFSPITTGGVWG